MTITEDKFNGDAVEIADGDLQIFLDFRLGRVKRLAPIADDIEVFLPNAQLTPWIEGGTVLFIYNEGDKTIFVNKWDGSSTGIMIGPNQVGEISLGATDETLGDFWRCNCRDILSSTTTPATTTTTTTTTTSSTSSITTPPGGGSTAGTQFTGTWGDPGGGNYGSSNEDPRIDPNYTNLPIFAAPPTEYGVLSPALKNRRLPAALSVSVVVSAINEGTDLEMTLASLSERLSRSDKIVVVDDGSVVSLEDRVRACEKGVPILFVRHELRRGCAQARDSGARAAKADLYIFVDSHMIFPAGWREQVVSAHSLHPTAILCPISADIAKNTESVKDGGHWGMNADLYFGAHGITSKWTAINADGRQTIRTPCVMGACYAVPHDVLRAIGGWAMGLRGWGLDEEFACVRAWMMGYEVRLLATTYAAHRYNRDPDMKRSDSESVEEESWVLVYVRAYTNYVLFGKAIWDGDDEQNERAFKESINNAERWRADRDFIIQRRKMNESEFWDHMNHIRVEARILASEVRHAVNQ